jgi:hypothetical protein
VERARCPRARARHLCSRAALDIMPAGIMTGVRGARCKRSPALTGQPAALRRLSAALHEAWSELSPWDARVPWTRAVVERRKASAPCRARAAPPPKSSSASGGGCRLRVRWLRNSVFRRSASLFISSLRGAKRRSNPVFVPQHYALDCFASLAMTPHAAPDRDEAGPPLPGSSDEDRMCGEIFRLAW